MASICTALTRGPGGWGLRVPIVGAPMAGVSGGKLAAAVHRAGGLGFIAVGHGNDLKKLRQEVSIFRQEAGPQARLSLGFISFSSCKAGSSVLQEVLDTHKPEVVQFFAPGIIDKEGSNILAAKDAGAKVLVQVGTLREAKEAIGHDVDGIIAQGREAGGHGLRTELGNGTLPLARAISDYVRTSFPAPSDNVRKPVVLAAGGIMDGHSLAACLALGCDGVVIGTRLWASSEALGSEIKKAALIDASGDNVVRTRVFDQIQNSYSANPWPAPFDTTGALHNATSMKWHGHDEALQEALKDDGTMGGSIGAAFRAAEEASKVDSCWVLSGEGVGMIQEILGAESIIRGIEQEAVQVIEQLHKNISE